MTTPTVPDTREATEAPSSDVPAPLVLIVDDESRIRALFRRWLVRAGYQVVEAGSGSEAIQQLMSNGVTIKLVVTDRNMPSGNGDDLIRAVQATWPGMPILCVTGYGDDMRTTVPILAKPVSGPVFMEAIERALAGAVSETAGAAASADSAPRRGSPPTT